MKKLLTMIIAAFIAQGCPAIVVPGHNGHANPNAATIFFHVGKAGKQISLLELSNISRADLEKITGRKMNLAQKISFHLAQKKLRKGINDDGMIRDGILLKAFSRDSQKGFHAGGFFLGLLLGPIGVIIAYLIKDDKKRNRVKWAWIGFGAWAVLFILAIIALNSLFTFTF